eukprot:13262066-Heterocapsa_arctica.AAC.1
MENALGAIASCAPGAQPTTRSTGTGTAQATRSASTSPRSRSTPAVPHADGEDTAAAPAKIGYTLTEKGFDTILQARVL